MSFTDTHCHIHEATIKAEWWDELMQSKWAAAGITDPALLIKEAAAADVTRLICVGCTLGDSRLAVQLAVQNSHCWASIGIHPHEAKDHLSVRIQKEFTDLLDKPRIVAIGECGLDYYYSHSPKKDQRKILEFQIQLALEHNLPIIFHVRDAFDDFWPIFDSFHGPKQPLRGVIHSFTANQQILQQILSRGLYVGINGIITFTRDPEQLAAAKTIPLDRLLLETDAPFLTPKPFRGTICKPKHVVQTAEFMSILRGETVNKIAETTTRNALKLFKLEEKHD